MKSRSTTRITPVAGVNVPVSVQVAVTTSITESLAAVMEITRWLLG
jgi:hypothetical protein